VAHLEPPSAATNGRYQLACFAGDGRNICSITRTLAAKATQPRRPATRWSIAVAQANLTLDGKKDFEDVRGELVTDTPLDLRRVMNQRVLLL
jgi:hypothetical protein